MSEQLTQAPKPLWPMQIGMRGELQPDDGPRGGRLWRRFRNMSLELLAFALVTVLLPILLVVAVLVDAALWLKDRKPWSASRLLLMLWWFLAGELRAWVMIAWMNIRSLGRDSEYRRRSVYAVRRTWATGHLNGAKTLFGLKIDVEDLELAGEGPIVVLMRHASIIDNMLPDWSIGRAHRIGLRFVIKRELEAIPTIDIAGRWVPTNFVRRDSGNTGDELQQLQKLTVDLGPSEGLMIYPEGTRMTPAKKARALERIQAGHPELFDRANALQNVMPPRLGGPIALLEGSRPLDVVFCGHVGFDGFVSPKDAWSGKLVGQEIKVKFWRYEGQEVPTETHELIDWLYEKWQLVDDWITANKSAR